MRGGLHVLEQGLLVTAGVAFLISVALSPLFIPFLRKLKFGQSIRDEGPKSHQKKIRDTDNGWYCHICIYDGNFTYYGD